ncbi:MAG: tetratricopeptide repeat protein [Thermoguttaceae bacterium]
MKTKTTTQTTGTLSSSTGPNVLSQRIAQQATQDYVFSWSWFLGGLVFLVLSCAGVYAVHSMQYAGMSAQFIRLADNLAKEERYVEAIDILSAFLSAQPTTAKSTDIWLKQCELWNTLADEKKFQDMEQMRLAVARQKQAIGQLSGQDALAVRERTLDLQWELAGADQSTVPALLIDARDLLKDWPDNPKAARVLALGLYRQIPTGFDLRPEDPRIDQVLLDALQKNPGEVDLVSALTEFYWNTDQSRQKYTSADLLRKNTQVRQAEALEFLNNFVRRNPEKAEAYMTRYAFKQSHGLTDNGAQTLDSDLVKALELAPNNTLALIHTGLATLQFAQAFAARNDQEGTKRLHDESIAYFEKAIAADPKAELAYVFLGELLTLDGTPDKAIDLWETALLRFEPGTSVELLTRLAIAYIEQGRFEEAIQKLNTMDRFWQMFSTKMERSVALNVDRTIRLIRAKLYTAMMVKGRERQRELMQAIAEAENLGKTADREPLQLELLAVSESNDVNAAAARGYLHGVFDTLPVSDYDTAGITLLSRLQSEGLMLLGQYEAELGSWDSAAEYYEKATRYPRIGPAAFLRASQMRQAANRPELADNLLRSGIQTYPESLDLRMRYVMNLFQQESQKPENSTRDYGRVEVALNDMTPYRNSLPNPWTLDVMQIQLQYAKGGGTVAAMEQALTALRALEESDMKGIPLYTELASQYSLMGALTDFNRVVEEIRNEPGGEPAYYGEMIADAARRQDMEMALLYADEAVNTLPSEESGRFRQLKKQLEEAGGPQTTLTEEEQYDFFKSQFADNRIFDPRAFFELGCLALERGDEELAKSIEERLVRIEGEQGVHWRYLSAMRQVKQAEGGGESLLTSARTIQRDIMGRRPEWNMTYVLLGEIEKAAGNNDGAIEAYSQAISRGNVQRHVFQQLISLLYQQQKPEEAQRIRARAQRLFGQGFGSQQALFKEPYQGYYDQIQRAVSEGNVGSAEKLAGDCFKRATENRESSDLVVGLNVAVGKVFMDAGQFDVAERFLSSAAHAGGQYVYPLAMCNINMGRADRAYELLIDSFSRNPETIRNLAPLLAMFAYAKPSEPILNRLDQLVKQEEPGMLEQMQTLVMLGDYWLMRNNQEHAVEIYEKGLEKDPENLVVLNNMALILAGGIQGAGGTGGSDQTKPKMDRAMQLINKALELKPDSPTLLDSKGLICLQAGNNQDAIPLFERSVELTCEGPMYVLHLAYAMLKNSDNESAIRMFDKVRPLLVPQLPRMSEENRNMFNELEMRLGAGQ